MLLHQFIKSEHQRAVILPQELLRGELAVHPLDETGDLVNKREWNRALNATVGSEGEHTIGLSPQTAVGAMRESSLLFSAGAQTVTVKGQTALPRINTGVTFSWLSEMQECPLSDPILGAVNPSPHRLSGRVAFSKQLAAQAPSLQGVVEADMMAEIGRMIDLAGIQGVGSLGEPIGLLNNSAITTTFTFGGAPTLAKFAEAERKLADNRAGSMQWHWIISNSVCEKLRTTPRAVGSDRMILDEDNTICGRPVLASANVVDDRVILGAGSEIFVVFFGPIELLRDPYSRDSAFELILSMTAYCDIVVRRSKAFVISTDEGNQ